MIAWRLLSECNVFHMIWKWLHSELKLEEFSSFFGNAFLPAGGSNHTGLNESVVQGEYVVLGGADVLHLERKLSVGLSVLCRSIPNKNTLRDQQVKLFSVLVFSPCFGRRHLLGNSQGVCHRKWIVHFFFCDHRVRTDKS